MVGYISFFLVKTRRYSCKMKDIIVKTKQHLHKNKPNSLYYKKINRKKISAFEINLVPLQPLLRDSSIIQTTN